MTEAASIAIAEEASCPSDEGKGAGYDECESRAETVSTGDGAEQSFSLAGSELDVGPSITQQAEEEEVSASETAKSGLSTQRALLGWSALGTDLQHQRREITANAPYGEEVLSFRSGLRGSQNTRFGKHSAVKLAGRLDLYLGMDVDSRLASERYEARLWDTYADLYLPHFDARAGNQFLVWGVNDLLSPNDVVSPRDLRFGPLQDPEQSRLPVLAGMGRLYTGPVSLEGIWVPEAPAHRFDTVDSNHAPLGPTARSSLDRQVGYFLSRNADSPQLSGALQPALEAGHGRHDGLRSGELGARLAVTTRRFDGFAYALSGESRMPIITLSEEVRRDLAAAGELIEADDLRAALEDASMSGAPAIEARHERISHFGVAGVTNYDAFVLRLEGSHRPMTAVSTVPVETGESLLLTTPRSLSSSSLATGVGYEPSPRFSWSLEAQHSRVWNLPASEVVYGFRGHSQTLFASRLAWNSREELVHLGVLGFVEARTEPAWAVRPAVELSGGDHVSVEVALEVYEGPPASLAGPSDGTDQIEITLRYVM